MLSGKDKPSRAGIVFVWLKMPRCTQDVCPGVRGVLLCPGCVPVCAEWACCTAGALAVLCTLMCSAVSVPRVIQESSCHPTCVPRPHLQHRGRSMRRPRCKTVSPLQALYSLGTSHVNVSQGHYLHGNGNGVCKIFNPTKWPVCFMYVLL